MIDARGVYWPEDRDERSTRWKHLRDRVKRFWHLEPLPYPRFDLPDPCPGCGESAAWIPRLWNFFNAPESASYRPRCQIRFKCIRCAFDLQYDIAVPRELAGDWRGFTGAYIRWREAKRALLEAGLIEPRRSGA